MKGKTKKLLGYKKCRLCGEILSENEFETDSNKCKTCAKLWNEWARGRKKTPEEIAKYGKGRVHLLVPTYKRVYSLYQFDWEKYAAIWKRIQQVALKYNPEIFKRTNPYRVLNLCYVLDENGNKQTLGDERHIFRYKTLEKVRKQIAKELIEKYNLITDESVLKYLYRRTGIVLEADKNHAGAELAHIWHLPIKQRLTINLRILKNLRKGLEIEEAVRKSVAR